MLPQARMALLLLEGSWRWVEEGRLVGEVLDLWVEERRPAEEVLGLRVEEGRLVEEVPSLREEEGRLVEEGLDFAGEVMGRKR